MTTRNSLTKEGAPARNSLTKEDAVSKLESVWNYIAMKENKHWPDKEDLAGGSVWKARQDIADLLHLLRNERNRHD